MEVEIPVDSQRSEGEAQNIHNKKVLMTSSTDLPLWSISHHEALDEISGIDSGGSVLLLS